MQPKGDGRTARRHHKLRYMSALPRLRLSLALSPSSSALDELLSAHGYCVLTHLEQSDLATLVAAEAAGSRALLHHRRRGRRSHSMGIARRHVHAEHTQTRRRSQCSRLPLAGVGVNSVLDRQGRLQRHQLHLLTDATALELVPWPARPPSSQLRPCVAAAAAALQGLAVQLLRRLRGGERLEAARAAQAAAAGDLSVLDLFVYPNEHAGLANMRARVPVTVDSASGSMPGWPACARTPACGRCSDR